MGRFSRNDDSFTIFDQDILWKSTVIICGLGGGGGVIAELLARLGIGNFILIDGDNFELSNLNRQIGAVENTLGGLKVEITANRLKQINSNISVKTCPLYLNQDNYKVLLEPLIYKAHTILIDCVDGYENKKVIEDITKNLSIPYVSGGNGIDTCISTLVSNKHTNSWLKKPKEGEVLTHSKPTLVWIQAAMQAQLAINYLLNKDIQYDKLFIYNLTTHNSIVCNYEDLV